MDSFFEIVTISPFSAITELFGYTYILEGCPTEDIRQQVKLSNFLIVSNLGFRRTQLQDFREDFKSLQKLCILDVSQNSISVIPEVYF